MSGKFRNSRIPARGRFRRKPEQLGTVLKPVIQRLGWEKGLLHNQVILSWSEIVGKEIAKHTAPLRVRGSKLFVEVENSSWMNHLHYLKPEILKKMNVNYEIRDIIFRSKR